jgi:hypothetical protein
MLKLLASTSFYDDSEPSITLLDLSSSDRGLEKKAAHEDIQAYVSKLSPKPGFTYLHINAMTAGEYHGSNRNADFFPEENLKRYYKTFETTPAYVYRSHINKDPKRSYGKVVFAVYNERMHRVELICECPDELVQDINERIKAGDFPTTSMACRTPADTCSICGNRAHSRQEYCSHLRTELNRLYPDGRKVFAVNDQPLTFFDISIVIRPADVNSSILQKVAYDNTIGSAELAEVEGLTEDGFHKRAQMKKLSELVKEISDGCYVVGAGKTLDELLGRGVPGDLPVELVEKLHHFDLSHTLTAMAHLGISPSIKFLAELIARKKLGEGYDGIGDMVEQFIADVPMSEEVPAIHFEEPSEYSLIVSSILKPYVNSSSLAPSAVEKRASSNVGYFGNGPHIEPTQMEILQQKKDEAAAVAGPAPHFFPEAPSWLRLILTLGGASLMAKYYITSVIDKKFKEHNLSPGNGVKIVIVKQASDYLVMSHLAKVAMVEALPKSKKEENPGMSTATNVGMTVTKRFLGNTNTKIGGKLATLLRIFSLGSKVSNLGA